MTDLPNHVARVGFVQSRMTSMTDLTKLVSAPSRGEIV
jgi:hypothetical protein